MQNLGGKQSVLWGIGKQRIGYSVRISLTSVIAGWEKTFIKKPGHKRRRKYISVVLTLKDAAGAAGCRLELQWSDKIVVSGPKKVTASQQQRDSVKRLKYNFCWRSRCCVCVIARLYKETVDCNKEDSIDQDR